VSLSPFNIALLLQLPYIAKAKPISAPSVLSRFALCNQTKRSIIMMIFTKSQLNTALRSARSFGGGVLFLLISSLAAAQEPAIFNCSNGAAEGVPTITVRVNIHYVAYDRNGVTENFYPGASNDTNWENGNYHGPRMIEHANAVMSNLKANPIGSEHYLGDSRIRFELYSDPNNTDDEHGGIWYWDSEPSSFPYNNVINIITDADGGAGLAGKAPGAPGTTFFYVYNWHRKAKLDVLNPSDTVAGVVRHEIGHIADLCHAYSCFNACAAIDIDPESECNGAIGACEDKCGDNGSSAGCDITNSGSANIMSAGVNNPFNALSPCQWQRFYGYLYSNNHPAVSIESKDCDDVDSKTPMVIETGQQVLWATPRVLDRPLIIEPNASLAIECIVYAAPEAYIQVRRGAKLTVNGGTIRRYCEDKPWANIWVEGVAGQEQPDIDNLNIFEANYADPNNVAGAVILTNNALLTGAKTAIQDGRRSASWNQDYYGGLVIAENANFINCSRGAAFMRYIYEQKSRFVNCDFIEEGNEVEGSAGVTIWNSYDILFEGCTFEGMDRYAIHGIDYGALVTQGNRFLDNRKGIDILNSFPLSGSEIIVGPSGSLSPTNQFFNYQSDIFTPGDIHAESGSLLGRLKIQNNEFFGSAVSVAVVGESSFEMVKNDFYDSLLGLSIGSTGSNFGNQISCNFFQGFVNTEIRIGGENSSLEILGNQLQPSNVVSGPAIRLFDNSSIDPTQGRPSQPADNCFESPSEAFQLSSSASSFLYYAANTPSSDPTCELVPSGSGNYSVFLTSDNQGDYCATLGQLNEDTVTVEHLAAKRQQLQSAHQAYTAAPNDTMLMVSYHLADKEKDRVLHRLLQHSLEQKDYTAAETVLTGENSKASARLLFGLQLLKEDFQAAQQLLNQYPQQTVDDQYFVDIMEVNIARLQQGTTLYSLPAAKKTRLIEIAQTGSMFRSYARALLMLLEGMEFDLGDLWQDNSNHQALIYNGSNTVLPVYAMSPNPTNGLVELQYPVTEQPLQLQIAGLYDGRVYRSIKLPTGNSYSLSLQDLPNGIYQVLILSPDGGNVRYNERLVIVK
jgi:hypothetical protein